MRSACKKAARISALVGIFDLPLPGSSAAVSLDRPSSGRHIPAPPGAMSSKGHHEMLDVQDSPGEAENDDPMRFGFAHYIKTSLHFLFWNKMSLLLVFVPIALICESTHASNGMAAVAVSHVVYMRAHVFVCDACLYACICACLYVSTYLFTCNL